MNWVPHTLLLLTTVLVAFVQAVAWAPRDWMGVQPDVLPALVVYAALHTRLAMTVATALLAGFGWDALSSGPFGLTVIPLISVGVMLHRRREILLRDSGWALAALGGAVTVVVHVMWGVLLLLLWPLVMDPPRGPVYWPEWQMGLALAPRWDWVWLWHLGWVGLFGAMATPFFHRWFRWVEGAFMYAEVPVVRYRGDREIKRGRL